MHKLVRCVRFTINPFLQEDMEGSNTYASRPSGEGLGVFFELCVGLVGQVQAATGFIENVRDIDKCVHRRAVPIFAERIKQEYHEGRHIGLCGLTELLRLSSKVLAGEFGEAQISELSLKLNPFRKLAIYPEDNKMFYFSEKFEFAAMHKLWNEDFSESRNLEVFGKCANPTGHGHNYIVEVTVKKAGHDEFCIGDFERTVDNELIKLLDHKNLNVDVEQFDTINPTVENIAGFAWERLVGKFGEAALHCVTIWETDRTYCSCFGNKSQKNRH
jgi:6-pyruvoyltetrahydropterin/6-carboxytetrahydropterin synthase